MRSYNHEGNDLLIIDQHVIRISDEHWIQMIQCKTDDGEIIIGKTSYDPRPCCWVSLEYEGRQGGIIDYMSLLKQVYSKLINKV